MISPFSLGIFLLLAETANFLRQSPSAKSENIVNIEVFGESKCVHTSMFLRQQLLPTYRLFGSRLRIQYHPYGVTRFTKCEWNGRHIECFCQHGPSECEKNALQSCIMSYLPDTDDHLELVVCVQGGASFDESVNSCLNGETLKWRVDRNQIVTCAKSDVGRSLMAHHGRVQNRKAPLVTWAPWIMVNGVRDKEAERMLQWVLCKRYLEPPPSPCAAFGTNSSESR